MPSMNADILSEMAQRSPAFGDQDLENMTSKKDQQQQKLDILPRLASIT
jgi:hypothetical protein